MFSRFSLLIYLVLALALRSSHVALAKDTAQKDTATQAADRKAIIAAQARIDGARAVADIPAIMNYIAPDFRFYSIARIEQDRETYGRIQANFARFSEGKKSGDLRVKTSVDNWQWRGPDAVIYTTTEFGTDAKNHSMSGTVRSREYWGKTTKGWQLRQIVEIMGQLTMDGETVEM